MRVTDSGDGSASLSNLTDAARTAALAGDEVASVSYSGGTSGSVNTAGSFIKNNGTLLIWAAGNSSNVLSGSRDDDVILVGATTSSDALASYSNRGPRVDLSAPGSQITTRAAAATPPTRASAAQARLPDDRRPLRPHLVPQPRPHPR